MAYFLDPEERHGLGTAMVDALLKQLHGGPKLDSAGAIPNQPFDCEAFLGSREWEVKRQVPATRPDVVIGDLSWTGRIDVYLTNDELGIAVVVENKIEAAVNNPLESYVRRAALDYDTVVLAILAPYGARLSDAQEPWVTKAVTYDNLLTQLDEEQSVGDPVAEDADVQRSLDLLDQFREVRQRGRGTVDYTNEAKYVSEFRQLVSEHADSVAEFFSAVSKVNKLVRARSARLEPLIAERLTAAGLETSWESHSGNIGKSKWVYAWNAYHLVDSDTSVELIMTPDPSIPAPITFKAYPGRSYAYYEDFKHIPIGVGWEAADAAIADAFLRTVGELLRRHP